MINLLLSGALGAMGKNVVSVAENFAEISVLAGFDRENGNIGDIPVYKSLEDIKEVFNVIVDFSHPSNLGNIIAFAKKRKLPLVVATTNLSSSQEESLRELSKIVPVFKSANFSYGVFVLEELVKKASSLLCADFDVEIIESHHNRKVDAPSGTAKMLVEDIKASSDIDYKVLFGRSGDSCKREKNELTVHSLRGGSVVGEHCVIFAGEDEIVEIKHTALSRRIFAVGAMKASLFIAGKENGIYSFKNMLEEN